MFESCFKEFSREFQDFKKVSSKIQKSFKEVSSMFHGSFKDVSKVFQFDDLSMTNLHFLEMKYTSEDL